ncbi:MAG: chain-length determining protein [Prevotella sp.]|nr:chain-length determining protein [Prevotella sp.]MBR1428256.1 chain-length determining protein [Prevotella sp.]
MNTSNYTFDLPTFGKIILKDKRNVCIWLFAAVVFAVIIAFSIPRVYKSNVLLAPETSSSNSILSSVSSLASMVGLETGADISGDAIYPEIYPDLMNSTNFLVDLFDVNVVNHDKTIITTYYDYLKNKQKNAWWDYPMILIRNTIKKIQGKTTAKENIVNPFMLTKDQYGVMNTIKKNIDCNVDKKTNVISITVTDQDPLICATMADSIKEKLQHAITEYRTNKAKNDLEFMQMLFDESKERYVKARRVYASYSDTNYDAILESVKSKRDDLENEMQLQYNIYTQVAQQLQMAKAKVQERTPAFTVVQSATVPVRHSNMPKIFILFAFLFLAFLVRCSWLIFKNRKELIIYRNE